MCKASLPPGPAHRRASANRGSATSAGAQEEPDQRQRRLHRLAMVIRGLPLRQQGAIIETKARRLLSDIDVECGTGEAGGDSQSQDPQDHMTLLGLVTDQLSRPR